MSEKPTPGPARLTPEEVELEAASAARDMLADQVELRVEKRHEEELERINAQQNEERRKMAMERLELEKQANVDTVTGLPTRRALDAFFNSLASHTDNKHNSIIFADLDRFKLVNDTHGHAAGDAILRTVADKLRGNIRATDMVARVGGDEFIILLPGADIEQAKEVAEKLRTAVEHPEYNGLPTEVTVSLGVGPINTGLSLEELAHQADQAMYQAKAAGRNQIAYVGELQQPAA